MKNSLILQIPQPCSRKWDEMLPSGKGRNCLTCEKEVIDFSNMSDFQLIDFYGRNDGKICGRFSARQLNREIAFPEEKSSSVSLAALVALAATLTASPAFSQTPTTKSQTTLVSTISPAGPVLLPATHKTISGQVVDERRESLPFSVISLSNKGETVRKVLADTSGCFTLDLKDGEEFDTLQINDIGYFTLYVTATEVLKNSTSKYVLETARLGEVIIVKSRKAERLARRARRKG